MTRKKKLAAAAAAAVAVALVAGTALRLHSLRAHAAPNPEKAASPLDTGDETPTPAVIVDVLGPSAVFKAAKESPWLKRAMKEPLGQGFAGSWAAFLGTRGTDLAKAFEGTVQELLVEKLLKDPFRLIFFGGGEATGTPALLLERPSSASRGAYQVLNAAAENGRYLATRCPGDEKDLQEKLSISRWLIAEHAVFASEHGGRIALAKNPLTVVQALCAELPPVKADRGVDVSVTVMKDGLGREALLGATLLGLAEESTFLFAVEGNRLVPRGISGKLAAPSHLDAAPPRDELLRLVPSDTGVLLLATLNLPDPMDKASMKEHLSGTYHGKLASRTVALVWNPTPGDTQLALVWPERDARALKEAFSGPNALLEHRLCGHVVLSSAAALSAAMERSCAGRGTSLLNGPPSVVAGLKLPVSLGVFVNAGAALSRVLGDSFSSEHPNGPQSPEIESARRLLEELPFFGMRGVTHGGVLAPGGFRS